MALAMKLGVEAGRLGYLAGRMEKKYYANPSSPLEQMSKLTQQNFIFDKILNFIKYKKTKNNY